MTPHASARHRLIDNVASNFAYVGAMALITLFVVPVYVHALGIAWNYVALCLTIQGFVFLLDAAIAPLMLRDVARARRAGQESASYRRFLRGYVGLGLSVFVIGEISTLLVAAFRHDAAAMPADLRVALHLAFVQFLFQFVNNAAIGYWNASQQQRLANVRLVAFITAKHVLALTLVLVWHTATAYMLPFALVGVIECVTNQRRLRTEHGALPVVSGGASAWRDVGGYGAATALGLLTTQVDRWYLCVALPADRYGIYYLASSLMLSMFSLQAPVTRAFLPHMATADRPEAVARAMRQVLLLLIAVPCLLLAAFAPAALNGWLHDAAIASAAAPTFRLLMLAVAMNAVFASTGMLLLHRHRYREIAAINATILIVQLLVLVLLTPRIGMLAGACAWLVWSAVQLAYAGYHARTAPSR